MKILSDGTIEAYDKIMKDFAISSKRGVVATVLDPRVIMDYFLDSDGPKRKIYIEQLIIVKNYTSS